jgi:hypothetical protein
MRASLLFFTNLIFLLVFSFGANAADIYAEYQMSGMSSTPMISKMYSKNGNMRTEVNMSMAGQQMTTTTLMLKSNPNVSLVFNSMSKTYTETKINSTAAPKNVTIKVLGTEKVGNYNCTHVKMSSDGKSWDVWYTKDLPSFNFPMSGNSELSSQKVINDLKSKGISGMMVKMVFQIPGANAKAITMQLVKYEAKTLDAALFTIPAGYTKNTASFDPEKMKNMTPEQRKEMIMKMMKEKMKQ